MRRRLGSHIALGLALPFLLALLIPAFVSDSVRAVPGNPIIKNVSLTDDAGNDRTGQQVDVNVGGTNPTYRFSSLIQEASGGWPLVEWVEFKAWYKNGNAGSAFNGTAGANYNFYINYTNTSDVRPVVSLKYPTTGEISFVGFIDSIQNFQTHILTMRFRFGNQIHNASATGAWSWALNVLVKDKNGRTDSVTVDFGIFRYVSMVLTGSPTNSTDTTLAILSPNQLITFSANGPFYLEVFTTDLVLQGGTATVGRQNIKVSGVLGGGAPTLTTFTYFTATDGTIDIYGRYNDGMTPSSHPAYASGTSETAVIQIQVDLPVFMTTGTYQTSMVYRLWEDTISRPP